MLRRVLLAAAVLSASLAMPATAAADPLCQRAGYYTVDGRAYYRNCNYHAVLGTTLLGLSPDASNVCIEGKTSEFLGSANSIRKTTGWVEGFRVDRILDGSYCTYW